MAQQQYESCIQACDACAAACAHCAMACLTEQNVAEMAACIKSDMDCADICRFASAVMARGSSRAKEVCLLCAPNCDACAYECEKHQHEHCKQRAKACRRCAEECRTMGQ
ncbi:four-helix bundle copper-binding protein [Paraburkholderia sp. CNPSo 3155]|nr:four-helix bundle copper-binding protein [Paraburkholderia atlantica]MPW08468.1 four-helix bundle copper-binding protein [Paraburkholderia atlantica]NUY35284.1 four-helix bundle copper-binding protein [Paraburkholderia atlantica]